MEEFENKVLHGDCLEWMGKFEDDSIDLTVTSPPYDDLRKYNGYSFEFEAVAKELYRVTKEGGIVIWVVNDKTAQGSETGTSFRQALFFKEIGFNLHDTMIYAKENWIPLTHNRYEQQFEYMFVFSKGKPKTFNPLTMETKEPGKVRKDSRNNRGENKSTREKTYTRVTGKEKRRSNIWMYKIGRGLTTKDDESFVHPAIFPEKLAEDHILSWSNENDVVFDPFLGSGTTAKMAVINNRKFIGTEMSWEYCEIANQRIEQAIKDKEQIIGTTKAILNTVKKDTERNG